MQKGDVRRINTAFQPLDIVAFLIKLGYKALALRYLSPFQLRKFWRGVIRSHVGPNHPAMIGTGIGRMAEFILKIIFRGHIGHINALSMMTKFPAVVHTPHPLCLIAAKIHGGQAVGTVLSNQTRHAVGGSVDDEVFAQKFDAFNPPTSFHFRSADHRDPILPHQFPHGCSRSHARQQFVFFLG